jgi:hypothetical protein
MSDFEVEQRHDGLERCGCGALTDEVPCPECADAEWRDIELTGGWRSASRMGREALALPVFTLPPGYRPKGDYWSAGATSMYDGWLCALTWPG